MLAAFTFTVLAIVLTAPQTVFAAETTVRLKNGGVVHGELMETQPNVSVRVRLADGEVREIPWANVARIEEGSPTTPRATAVASPSPSQPEIIALQHERAEIEDGGPAVMTIAGGLSFLIFTPIGLGLFALDAACDSTSSSLSHTCVHAQGAAIVFTVLGLGGGVIGLWGFIKLLNNSSRREQIDLRIKELHERSALGLDVVPRLGGGELRLSLAL
jgi:hypothetical protein